MAMINKRLKSNSILQNASRSAEIVASIDDILTQILIKVPIKPLVRSKLVSKKWLSLISSRDLCLRRNPMPNHAQGYFVCIKKNDVYRYEYVPLFPNNSDSFLPSINLGFTAVPLSTVILHSCKGLLLCCSTLKWIEIDSVHSKRPVALAETGRKLYVYNPTTNFSFPLPDWTNFFGRLPDWPSLWALSLATTLVSKSDPVKSPHMSTTLVFDPVKSPHYKVVLVVRIYSEKLNCQILVYWSKTNSWSHGGKIGMDRYDDLCRSGVYWNGSVHWLNAKFSTRNPQNSIRFHVDSKMFGEMPSPPIVRNKSKVYFGESSGHLHFIECTLPQFNVYEMKKDYSEWFVKNKVDLSPFIVDYPEVIYEYGDLKFCAIYVLSVIRRESDEDSKLVLRIPRKVIKFNFVDGTWEKLCDFVHENQEAIGYWYAMSWETNFEDEYELDYIQSLCSVSGG